MGRAGRMSRVERGGARIGHECAQGTLYENLKGLIIIRERKERRKQKNPALIKKHMPLTLGLGRQREVISEFMASLVYRASSEIARARH